jgi:aminoglycoside phosphotransferase (APT) family kinase protein
MEAGAITEVRRVLARHLPGHRVTTVAELDAGLDNRAYLVDGELVVRFSGEPSPERRAALIERDARVLAAVAPIATVAVPEPLFAAPADGCLAYRMLPGTPLLGHPAPRPVALGRRLGELLAALHSAPAGPLGQLAGSDAATPAEWQRHAAVAYVAARAAVPMGRRAAVEAFLGGPAPAGPARAVFSHNDLGAEHVLVDAGAARITGVIDWSDAAVVDPAHDFGLIERDLGPAALAAALDAYGEHDAALRERAGFHARCTLFEDLAYAVDNGRAAHVGHCLAALARLFAARQPRTRAPSGS